MDVATTAAVVGTGTAVLVALVPVIRMLRRMSGQMSQLQEDWYGEAARPGYERRMGVPERLQRIEKELTSNGGSSTRDAISRIELNQQRLGVDHQILTRRMDQHLEQVAPAIEELLEWRRQQNAIPAANPDEDPPEKR